jgi:ABC-type uncharacterized transport system ATPase subunit
MVDKGSKVVDGTLAEVKAAAERGVLIDYDGDSSVLRDLPGVSRFRDDGGQAELFLNDGTDPQEILDLLVSRIRIKRFDIRAPTLRDAFERMVEAKDRA